jgi:Xaa-Pro aminopeptidase
MSERVAQLREALREVEAGAFLVSQPENRRYLSGFTGSTGWLLIAPDRALILTDFRYLERVQREVTGYDLVRAKPTYDAALKELLAELQISSVAFESDHVTVAQLQDWRDASPPVEWVPTQGLVETQRQVKDPSELEALRQAIALADEAWAAVLPMIRPGLTTEVEMAWNLEVAMRTRGAEKLAFDIIVGSGPNGALPHAGATERVIGPGEPVVVDMGCVVDGYHSDMTRTVCWGTPPPDYLDVWHLVLRAHDTAKAGMRAGMEGAEADRLARDVIQQAGYGEHFGHGLGHGVGLAVHEGPRAGTTAQGALPAGSVITVEPGVYLSGRFGVRIEDIVVVGEDGVETLTSSPKVPVL